MRSRTSTEMRPDARHAARLGQRGAAAVEFSLVLPLLVMLVFGIVEFGAAWSQNTDVRHGARETARLAAVNYNPLVESGTAQTQTIVSTACSRMGMDSGATVSLELETVGGNNVGDVVTVVVEQPFDSITGFVPVSATLRSEIDFRLERPASWAETTTAVTC